MKPSSPASYMPVSLRFPNTQQKTEEILQKNKEWITKLLGLIEALNTKNPYDSDFHQKI